MIEILALNAAFEIEQILNPLNIQINSKYYTFGEFSIQLKAEDYSELFVYIYAKGRGRIGEIKKVEFSTVQNKSFVQLSGHSLEKTLDDKIVFPVYNGSGNIEVVARDMFSIYKDFIPQLSLGPLNNIGENIEFQTTGTELGSELYDILETQEMSYKVNYDVVTNDLHFEVYQGLDRTQSQSVNDHVVFSSEFKNLTNLNFIKDSSNFKNYAIVAGEGDGSKRIFYITDLSGGGYKYQLFVDARDLQYEPSTQTKAEYDEQLHQRGLNKLTDYKLIENITFDALTSNLEFLVDYKLGDKCNIVISEFNITLEARIIAVYEVYKQNTRFTTLEFGNKILKNMKGGVIND